MSQKKKNKTKNQRFVFGHFFYFTKTLIIYTLTSSSLLTIQKPAQTGGQLFFLFGIGALIFTTSTSFRYTLSIPYKMLITQFFSFFSVNLYVALLQRNTCVLGEKERTPNQWLRLLTNGLVGLSTWTHFFSRALPLLKLTLKLKLRYPTVW